MKLIDQIQEVETQFEEVDVTTNHFDGPDNIVEKLRPWKGVLIAVLTLIKLFTGKRADEKINQLISGINMFL